ncbi:Rrf2 family transcriptional regulator [Streptococcus sp. DD13]|uniref:Rrf2 family transcriptional regulator n=1 Tax=Streptococcus sp. DD13 TaxID=1777881 RepID=UPI000798D7B7|nr:Rrf2 family transcriptional regulator [Streptococcus sp. DD13]KXT77576.1 Rrf2 family transcriptional regulator, group III [Streptococcus sp. DD13]
MQISSRFTIASHLLTLVALQQDDPSVRLTSDYIAGSVGVNPVIIRKTLSQLRNAGLVTVQRGAGGVRLTRSPQEINLYQVYQAVDSIAPSGELFSFHENPNPECPIGRNIHTVLDGTLVAAQTALETQLAEQSLAQVVQDANEAIQTQVPKE